MTHMIREALDVGASYAAHALGVAQKLYAAGSHYALRLDIRRFYPSTRMDLVERALVAEIIGIEPEMLGLVRQLYDASVVRRPGRPDVRSGAVPGWEPPRGSLAMGPASAPPLGEVVATVVLHRPLDRLFGDRIRLLRWVDDCLVLSSDPCLLVEVLFAIRELLAEAGYELHPEKSSSAPVDLRCERLTFLGKDLDRGRVLTPLQKVEPLATAWRPPVCAPRRTSAPRCCCAVSWPSTL